MQKITTDSLLSEWIIRDPALFPIVYLTGIGSDYDGKSIRQICKEKAINETYLLSLVKVILEPGFLPSEMLPSYSVFQLSALSSALYPYFLKKLEILIREIQKTFRTFRPEEGQRKKQLTFGTLKPLFSEYRLWLSNRSDQLKQTIIPHVSTVYELYYSPDYTSERSDSLNYSLEFYDGKIQQLQQVFEKIRQILEQVLDLKQADLEYAQTVFAFGLLHREILTQDRIEKNLLKPLVLQMEESIVTTYRKKNKNVRRNNYLSMPVDSPPSDVLSAREKEVLQLVAQGLMNKEIADHLHIGLTTVISHRKNIVEKLGIKTIPGLTVYAYTQGYLDDSILTNED
jgi:Response regulator containing a CheY-like receiver domain and an HTH DNA-binding domain